MSNPCPPTDSCACSAHCCIADTEIHYQLSFASNAGAIFLDDPTSVSLSNRIAMEIYNAGSKDFEFISSQANFPYGQGRVVPAGTSVSLAIGPGVRHYVRCSTGNSCDVRVTELGKSL